MPTRNPYRALMISAPRTGNTPEQVARAIMPELPRGRALEVLGNQLRLVSVGSSLQNLSGNWYMIIQRDWVIFAFGPQSGISEAAATEITVKARMSTTPIPWSDEETKIRAMGRTLPVAFKNFFF